MITDNNKCEKCNSRTALISGYWYFQPDSEPYMNGIQKESLVNEGEQWINGLKCDDCGHIQDLFVDQIT
jgi:hypothetical protein